MITYEELNLQNHKITELTNILNKLLVDRVICDAETTHELFFRYVELVRTHLQVTENNIYSVLLSSGDRQASNLANSFMSGSKEIKRVYNNYLKRWCKTKKCVLEISNYERFLEDTDELFEMVLDRIQAETEQLYPLVRKVTGDASAIA
jgi:succinate dehydrogenase flavin-adding protein (antitoxin of CptAB toxin-antitoxin module)